MTHPFALVFSDVCISIIAVDQVRIIPHDQALGAKLAQHCGREVVSWKGSTGDEHNLYHYGNGYITML